MFRQKTTIIVGAGASCELGLPSGDQLKSQILALLSPGTDNAYGFSAPVMIDYMKMIGGPNVWDHQAKFEPVRAAAERIRRGLPLALSVDNYLHTHQGDEEVEQLGKLAIALNILGAERHSHLFRRVPAMSRLVREDVKPEMAIDGNDLAATWYPAFGQLLMSGVQRDDVSAAFRNLRFVIFNYDRCLEQYLWMALQAYFDISGEKAAEVLAGVSFIHPYGSLGPLPWRAAQNAVALGEVEMRDYPKLISRIRTFTESVRSEIGNKVKEAVAWADTLLILGFGYLDQNIQLLDAQRQQRATQVLSTAFNVSRPDQEIMRRAMMRLGQVGVEDAHIDAGSCRGLFDNYRLHLSLR